MPAADLRNMDVDALLALRADVESLLAERVRDLRRQIAVLDGSGRVGGGKRRGRPPGGAGLASAMKGVKVPPKYRGPDGETWAGRGATPRWLSALLKEGHSIEEFAIAQKGGKAAAAAGKKVTAKKRGRKPAGKRKRG
jgi:DNA-binding protein H-NS